jgi:hypothetical protein
MAREKANKWDKWEEENDFLAQEDKGRSYYEDEVLPAIEKKALAEKAKCRHDHFYIYCSQCKHVLGSELQDPYEVLKAHRAKHINEMGGSAI